MPAARSIIKPGSFFICSQPGAAGLRVDGLYALARSFLLLLLFDCVHAVITRAGGKRQSVTRVMDGVAAARRGMARRAPYPWAVVGYYILLFQL